MRRFKVAIGLLAVAAVSSAVASRLTAQELSVAVGDRVRATGPEVETERLVGTLSRLNAEICILEEQSNLLCMPTSSLAQLEVSRGTRSRAGSGALYGGFAGLAAGLLFVAAACDSNADVDCGAAAAFWGAVGAGTGALLGAVIGSAARSELWVNVPLDGLEVTSLPHVDGGAALVFSVRF